MRTTNSIREALPAEQREIIERILKGTRKGL